MTVSQEDPECTGASFETQTASAPQDKGVGQGLPRQVSVKEPAPVGPQPKLRACQWIEGGALGSPARCVLCQEEPGCLFAHGSFRRTPQPQAPAGLLGQACEACRRTVPAPTLRRLASAPLVRTKLHNDIAELA